MNELPSAPSGLIRLARDDLEWVRSQPGYTIDMWKWHRSVRVLGERTCLVCMAGAVMARSLGAEPVRDVIPSSFGSPTRERLHAINAFQSGSPKVGLIWLDLHSDAFNYKRILSRAAPRGWVQYENDPDEFLAQMGRLADALEEIDL